MDNHYPLPKNRTSRKNMKRDVQRKKRLNSDIYVSDEAAPQQIASKKVSVELSDVENQELQDFSRRMKQNPGVQNTKENQKNNLKESFASKVNQGSSSSSIKNQYKFKIIPKPRPLTKKAMMEMFRDYDSDENESDTDQEECRN